MIGEPGDEGRYPEYDLVIKTQIKQGIVEVVEHPEQTDMKKVHYLPHHAVVYSCRPDSPTQRGRVWWKLYYAVALL